MTVPLLCEVTDDDGVLVLASANASKARISERPYDDAFPKELVEAAAAGVACGWQTQESGDASIVIEVGPEAAPGAVFIGSLAIGADDELLVLPDSQFTVACDSRRGVPEAIPGLTARCAIAAGRYACWVRWQGPEYAFVVSLVPGQGPQRLPSVPLVARPS